MTTPKLYRGLWPQNVSKLAKYAVRLYEGSWKVTVLYEAAQGLRYLAVHGGGQDLAQRINSLKTALQEQPGGAFYVNEYRHVIVPVSASSGGAQSHYYYCSQLGDEFSFEFEGQPLTTKALHPDGTPLNPGEAWVGPRPGIPYVLAAGGADIYYETPALTDDDPPRVRPSMTRRVELRRVLGDAGLVRQAVAPVARVRGHQGGRFYVNEHGAMFTPVDAGDGNGLNYIYCGQINRSAWFPQPAVD